MHETFGEARHKASYKDVAMGAKNGSQAEGLEGNLDGDVSDDDLVEEDTNET